MKTTFPEAFADSGKSGGGASGGGAGGGSKRMALSEFNNLTPKERAAFMASKGELTE
jgi:hypothetical protein